MVNVKAHTRKTKRGLVRVGAHRRACSGKRYVIYGKVKGGSETPLWEVDKAGKPKPMAFKLKKRAVERAEIWRRRMEKKNLKPRYTIGEGTINKDDWRVEPIGTTWARRTLMKLK